MVPRDLGRRAQSHTSTVRLDELPKTEKDQQMFKCTYIRTLRTLLHYSLLGFRGTPIIQPELVLQVSKCSVSDLPRLLMNLRSRHSTDESL